MRDHRSDAFVGSLFVLGAIISWGAYFPLAKLILQKLSPLVFLVFRFGIGAAVLLLLSVRQGKSFRIQKRDWPGVLWAAVIGIVLHQFIQLAGLERTSATNTGWILTLIPPITGILAWVVLRERIGLRQAIGLGIAMTGVMLFVTNGDVRGLSLGRNVGDMLAFGSVLTWSSYTIITKSRLQRYDALPLSAIHMGLGSLIFLAVGAGSVADEGGTAVCERLDHYCSDRFNPIRVGVLLVECRAGAPWHDEHQHVSLYRGDCRIDRRISCAR